MAAVVVTATPGTISVFSGECRTGGLDERELRLLSQCGAGGGGAGVGPTGKGALSGCAGGAAVPCSTWVIAVIVPAGVSIVVRS
jgi:hypothetical protein